MHNHTRATNVQIPIRQMSFFIRWNNQLVKIEHIRNRVQLKSDRGEEEINFIFILYASILVFIYNICFVLIFVSCFFLLCFDLCVWCLPFFVQTHLKIDHFTHHHHRLCFIPVLVVSHYFSLSNHKYFLTALTPTHVLLFLCLHAIFSFRFALAFSSIEMILMEIHFIGCIFLQNLAQVTQWGLIMHGTETPAQPNDPANFDFPQPDANLFGEIDQNLDFDSRMETGQWRHMQQVIHSS